MGFLARTTRRTGIIPLIIYLHEFGAEQFTGQRDLTLETDVPFIKSSIQRYGDGIYRKDMFRFHRQCNPPSTPHYLDYLIMTFWGIKEVPMVDVFGFGKDYETWPGNPEVYAWVYQNKVYMPTPNITCTESLQMLGKETEHRRKCRNLEEYLKTRPDLGDLQPKYEL